MVGNVYLGKVQNVLPSMEAAFVDIGRGRNAVLYAGEVNWDATGLEGRARSIEQALQVRRLGAGAGHQGPDRAQGRPADQPHRAVRPAPGLRAARQRLRDQPQAVRHRAQAAARRAEEAGARRRRRDRADRGRGRERGRAGPRRQAAAGAVGGHPGQGRPRAARRRCSTRSPTWSSGSSGTCSTRTSASWSSRASDAYDEVEPYLSHVSPDLVDRLRRYTGAGDVFAEHAHRRADPQGRWTARCSCPPAVTW